MNGVVYFIRAGDCGPIKIGFTRGCPHARMAQLQTGCPIDLRLLAVSPGDITGEQALHQRFAHLRMRGEWFKSEDELITFVQGVAFATTIPCPQAVVGDDEIAGLLPEELERIVAHVVNRVQVNAVADLISAVGLERIEAMLARDVAEGIDPTPDLGDLGPLADDIGGIH